MTSKRLDFLLLLFVPLIPRLFLQITNDLSDTCLPYFCDTEAYRGVEPRPSHDFIARHDIAEAQKNRGRR